MRPITRAARWVPGARGLVDTLERTRRERDRLRDERDELAARLRVERGPGRAPRQRDAPDATQPSFHVLYESMKRQRAWAEQDHGVRHPVWEANSKIAGRRLAESLGLSVPRLLAGPVPVDELDEPAAERFVVKPVEGFSRRGVYVLTRDGAGLLSVLDQRHIGWEEVRADLHREAETGGVSTDVVVEELVPSAREDRLLPDDWKCYCIGGRVELVMQKDAGDRRAQQHARFKFWTPRMEDLGPVRHPRQHDATLPAPPHAAQLVEDAERIAAGVAGPFVRVDLYDTPGGVVFGEITPHPGGTQRFSPDVDRRLGEAFERALGAEIAAVHGPSRDG